MFAFLKVLVIAGLLVAFTASPGAANTPRAKTSVSISLFSASASGTPKLEISGTVTSPDSTCIAHRRFSLGWVHNGFHVVGFVFTNQDGTFDIKTDGPYPKRYGYRVASADRGNVICSGFAEKFII